MILYLYTVLHGAERLARATGLRSAFPWHLMYGREYVGRHTDGRDGKEGARSASLATRRHFIISLANEPNALPGSFSLSLLTVVASSLSVASENVHASSANNKA